LSGAWRGNPRLQLCLRGPGGGGCCCGSAKMCRAQRHAPKRGVPGPAAPGPAPPPPPSTIDWLMHRSPDGLQIGFEQAPPPTAGPGISFARRGTQGRSQPHGPMSWCISRRQPRQCGRAASTRKYNAAGHVKPRACRACWPSIRPRARSHGSTPAPSAPHGISAGCGRQLAVMRGWRV
jgi:hypothetical protein